MKKQLKEQRDAIMQQQLIHVARLADPSMTQFSHDSENSGRVSAFHNASLRRIVVDQPQRSMQPEMPLTYMIEDDDDIES